ncbi:hypothetical protein [Novipirellula herctigrandis]|uniref:hypothetical protein n=1 Tax=Novipirellula herctigrandis TaxID=2527986 RepID=UPI003AF38C2A
MSTDIASNGRPPIAQIDGTLLRFHRIAPFDAIQTNVNPLIFSLCDHRATLSLCPV